jgi:uncharacterized damage-inducible protein DinB
MNSQATHIAQSFAAQRGALTALLAELPEEHAGFVAWEGGMSFLGLGDHLDGSSRGLLAALSGQAPSRQITPSASLAEVRGKLEDGGQQIAAALSALSDEDLAREVPAFGGRTMKVSQLAEMVTVHEAHHKGQLWVMARLVGVKPPFFMQMG